MFEFSFDLGPLHLHLAIGEPANQGGEYVELATDTELAADEDTDEPEDRVGFRGHN